MKSKIRSICRSIAHNKYFGISIFILILLSVFLIFVELAILPPDQETWVHVFNNYVVYVFIVELTIRWIAIGRFRDFIREYWVDVIAVIPMLPYLRFLRFFRLLRLLRMVSLLVFMRRHLRSFIYFFKKRLVEYLLIFALIAFVVIFATLSLIYFERDFFNVHVGGDSFERIGKSFWITIYSLFAGEYITEFPTTLGGKLVLVVVMFSGMGLFAILTGTVSAIMIERLKEGAILGKLNFKDMEDHIIICGWNDHVPKILMEFQSDPEYRNRNFVIIAELEELPDMSYTGVDMTTVYLVKQDFIKAETLSFVNVEAASIAIILADVSNKRTGHDADARTVLTALTIEKLNPKIYSCAELLHPENESHLAMSSVESIVLSSNISAYMMTQASMKASVVPFYTELLRPSQGNQIYEVPFPEDQIGKNFDDLISKWKKECRALIVGVIKPDGKVLINPEEYVVKKEDRAIVISCKKPQF